MNTPTLPRRDFLRKSAGTLGAVSALSVLPPSISRALAANAAVETGTIKDIKHIVILMQENRSFDHYFGTMRGVRGFGDRFPIPLSTGKSVFFQPNATAGGPDIQPFRRDSTKANALIGSGTPHSFSDMHGAWQQGRMDRWIQYKNQATMGYFLREDIPFQFALADAFTICDHYHCSVLTGTDPNRIVFWSGSNFNPELRKRGINSTDRDAEPNNSRCWPSPYTWVEGRAQQADGTGQINPATGTYNYKYTNSAFEWATLPDLLQQAGVTWHIYQNMNDNWTGAMHGCLAFKSFRTAQPGSPVYEHGLTGPGTVTGGLNSVALGSASSTTFLDKLRQDVIGGTLPQVSWVLPTQYLAEHPGSNGGVRGAANLISQVLDALTANPEVWSKTAFFITFDENDGFFDHLPMPAVPSYDANGNLMGKATLPLDGEYFDNGGSVSKYLNANDTISGQVRPHGMSSRVPMYVVSPWSRGGWVDSQVFDHTSIGMFLEKRFGITVDAISPWHRAVAGDLTSCFNFVNPNDATVPQMPATSNFETVNSAQRALANTGAVTTAPNPPQPLYQERGTRPSRALPYELQTNAQTDAAGARVQLTFVNSGKQGAVFHVYDKLHLDRIPRRYTVEAGKQLQDDWSAVSDSGMYDLWVLGPNGFHRHFKGNVYALRGNNAAQPEMTAAYQQQDGDISLVARNKGAGECVFTVRPNAAYPAPNGLGQVNGAEHANANGNAPVKMNNDGSFAVRVKGGNSTTLSWNLDASGKWYDFEVTCDSDAGFYRRFAGRVETGKAGVSDPAMALHLLA